MSDWQSDGANPGKSGAAGPLRELSLAINTPDGLVLVVGCSHPGIDKIVEAAATINPKIQVIAGGFHLVVAPDDTIAKIVRIRSKSRTSRRVIVPASLPLLL